MSRSAHTPLIQQYLEIKSRHPDAILFFRVGDFYEMFFEDAEEGSRLLGLTLTSRNNGGAADVPLAGVPVRALGEYLPRLVRLGRSVAICEQVEDASEADGLVRREVVEVVTPGTVLEEALLAADRNNFLAAVAGADPLGVATVDLSTGEFEVRSCPAARLADVLGRLEPAEVLLPAEAPPPPDGAWTVTRREAWRFDPALAADALRAHYGVLGTEGFGLEPGRDPHLTAAAGALVAYLEELKPAGVRYLRPPRVQRAERFLHLDEMTRRNLELVQPLRDAGGATLLGVLDRTRTPMGVRLLRRWILEPLLDLEEIGGRHSAVAELTEARERRRELRDRLAEIRDLERLAARLSGGRIAPRELLALGRSLCALPAVARSLDGVESPRLRALAAGLDPLADVREEIAAVIDPEAPAALADGGVIRGGHSSELDGLRAVRGEAVDFIARLQASERRATGIESLKVGYNRVFGYYIEVTRPNLPRVPERYQRRQTLTGAERFATPELKEWESKVVGAEARIAELEAGLFRDLRERLAAEVGRLQATAERIAELDVLAGLAEAATRHGYVRPMVDTGYRLEIRGGRHPVVERTLSRGEFIPNDVVLDRDAFIMVLTGPNMAGKSTVLRQVGLIVLMAQIGSFVPASAARIGLCDRVFTRVGASDSLARGHSTFMVEMTETAAILNGATERSLLLLDEIGRGTSTYDGVAIAWALTEHVHDRLHARTIFATHYHELVELDHLLDGVAAFNVAVREAPGGIVFLRRLEPGGCDRSYGVHVARLAGLPREVIERATLVLHELEAGPGGSGRLGRLHERERGQLSLFAPPSPPSLALERLRSIDPERMTPIEALAALAELRELDGGAMRGEIGSERR